MRGNTFVTTRGDQISRPHERRPPQGQIRGPYPKIDKVSKGIWPCWRVLPKLVEDCHSSKDD